MQNDARAVLTRISRRRWGMSALRANAGLHLDRLAYVGRGAVEAVARRATAQYRRSSCLKAWRRYLPRVWGTTHLH